MSLSIQFDGGSSRLFRSINLASYNIFKSAEKISSGLRINVASDDPAGLVISEHLRSQIAGLNQNIENTSALIRKYETASSTVSELRSHLTELRSLAVGAANEGGNSEAGQLAYQRVAEHSVASFNRVIETADYNGANLLDGSEGSVAAVDELSGIDLSTAESAQASIAIIDNAAAKLDESQAEMGAYQKSELEARMSNLETTLGNLEAAESQIRDADIISEVSNFIASNIRQRAGIAMLAHLQMNSRTVIDLLDYGRE